MRRAGRGLLPGTQAAWLEPRRRELEDVRLRALEVIGRAGLAMGGTQLASAERAARSLIDAEPYRGTLVRMGGSNHILIVLKGIREKIGKGPGDTVDVVLEEDLKPRRVTIPADLARALKARPKARLFFRGLSHTNQKEYAGWIEGAKRAETRARRIARTVALLAQGKLAR